MTLSTAGRKKKILITLDMVTDVPNRKQISSDDKEESRTEYK